MSDLFRRRLDKVCPKLVEAGTPFFLPGYRCLGSAHRLKVVYPSIGLGNALLWIAKDGGVFAENNLDVQLIFIGSSTVAAQALLAGDVPIGTATKAANCF